MEIQFSEFVSKLSSTLGPGPAETPGCGGIRAAWRSLWGSDPERLVLSPDTVRWGWWLGFSICVMNGAGSLPPTSNQKHEAPLLGWICSNPALETSSLSF